MAKFINVKLNGKKLKARENETVLELAYRLGLKIPHLCYHPDTSVKANCRVCVVEIAGWTKLPTSCSTRVYEGMDIKTDSLKVKRARKVNLEFIFSEHIEKCPTCPLRPNCKLLEYAGEYKLKITRFSDRKKKRNVYKFGPAIEIDGTQCIDCRNCIDMCNKQEVGFLKLKNKGCKIEIAPVTDGKHDCVYCGQCAVHCPVTSAQEQLHYGEVQELLNDKKDKIVIAQIAPSIRSSIGEIFKLPYGKVVTGQLRASLKKLGFDYVFDTNFGADITTITEATELVERLKDKKSVLPMFTACCPSWVRFVEFYYPEFIPNLTTARSPQIHLGGVAKTYWAKKMKIDPKNIVIVSIMPCISKKFEAKRPELKVQGVFPVDHVLTTRELGYLLYKNKIDISKIKPEEADNPLGEYSGAGAIYGASGGVTESALRTACAILNKKNIGCIDFKEVRGLEETKEAEVMVGGRKINVAVVNTLGSAKKILEDLLVNPKKYDYVEVMACPGGCIGGGGQPIPTTPMHRKKRAESLYKIDKSLKVRQAHQNKGAKKAIKWLKKDKKLEHNVLHTTYEKVRNPEALKNGEKLKK
jgi:iron-only hydrogenase group A